MPCTGWQAEYAVLAGSSQPSPPPSEAPATNGPAAGPTRVTVAASAPASAQQSSSESRTLHNSFMQDALKLQKAHAKTNRKVCPSPWRPASTRGLRWCLSLEAHSLRPVPVFWLTDQALSC